MILLIGPKGAGKSTAREWLETRGWRSVYMESLYDELDKARKHTVDNPNEDLRDLVYEIACDRMFKYARVGNVVFDGTGSSHRFDSFYQTFKTSGEPCYLVYIDAAREDAFVRTQQRDISAHRPFDRMYFDRIWDDCRPRKALADKIIENNGTKKEYLVSFKTWFDSIQRIESHS